MIVFVILKDIRHTILMITYFVVLGTSIYTFMSNMIGIRLWVITLCAILIFIGSHARWTITHTPIDVMIGKWCLRATRSTILYRVWTLSLSTRQHSTELSAEVERLEGEVQNMEASSSGQQQGSIKSRSMDWRRRCRVWRRHWQRAA